MLKLKRRGYTMMEVLVAIAIIALLMALLLPVLSAGRTLVRKASSASNQRSIAAALMAEAQSNKNWLAGMKADGSGFEDSSTIPARPAANDPQYCVGSAVEARYWILLNRANVDPRGFISPGEIFDRSVAVVRSGVGLNHYSYGMRFIAAGGSTLMRDTWRIENSHSQALTLGDRDINNAPSPWGNASLPGYCCSIWKEQPGQWQGHLCWGDGHVSYEKSGFQATRCDTFFKPRDWIFSPGDPGNGYASNLTTQPGDYWSETGGASYCLMKSTSWWSDGQCDGYSASGTPPVTR